MMKRAAGAAIGLTIGALLVSGCVAAGTGGKPVTVTVTAPSGVAVETTQAEDAAPPQPTDFAVDVTITEQKCFGSAGCSYELNINPRFVGVTAPKGKWKVIYQINGGEDPQMGNFTVDGEHIRWDSEKRSDGDEGATFTATVTQVLEDY